MTCRASPAAPGEDLVKNSRREPVSSFTFLRAAAICSLVRNHPSISDGDDDQRDLVSESRNISFAQLANFRSSMVFLVAVLFQPALPTRSLVHEFILRVSSRRKRVCMSMMNWSLSAAARSWAIAGVAASALLTANRSP